MGKGKKINAGCNSTTYASIDDFRGDDPFQSSEDHVQLMMNRKGSEDKIIRGVPNLFPGKV